MYYEIRASGFMIKTNIQVCKKCDWYYKCITSSVVEPSGNITKSHDEMCKKKKSLGGYLIGDGLPIPMVCKCKLEHIVLLNEKVKEI